MGKGVAMKKGQTGFTLIEIAIVLVIIGLLLGGVLKGQELINSAKVKNLANDMRAIQTAVFAFQDKYKALPGDYLAATANSTFGGTGYTTGDGNGVISAAEAPDAWDQLRKGNLRDCGRIRDWVGWKCRRVLRRHSRRSCPATRHRYG